MIFSILYQFRSPLVCEILPTGDYLQCGTELSLEIELTYPLTSYPVPESKESVGSFNYIFIKV